MVGFITDWLLPFCIDLFVDDTKERFILFYLIITKLSNDIPLYNIKSPSYFLIFIVCYIDNLFVFDCIFLLIVNFN